MYHTSLGTLFTWAPTTEPGRWPGVCKATAWVCHHNFCVLTLDFEVCLQVEMFSAEYRVQLMFESFQSPSRDQATCVHRASRSLLSTHYGT